MIVKLIASALLTSLLCTATASGATWYVPDDYASIQDALAGSANGDTIVVRPGHYMERIDFLGKAVTLMSEKGPAVTTIDGTGRGTVVNLQSGEGPATILSGFTITGGNAADGAGIRCIGASPTITQNVITGNIARGIGAGIYCEDGNPIIRENVITANSSDDRGGGIGCEMHAKASISENRITANNARYSGGGINCDHGAAPWIANNVISDNYTGSFGGAILADESGPIVSSNRMTGNYAAQSGGAVYMHESSCRIGNNLVANNEALLFGGGLVIDGQSTASMANNTIVGNKAGAMGGGLHLWDGTVASVANTILWGNQASNGQEISLLLWTLPPTLNIDYSDVAGGQGLVHVETGAVVNWGARNIDAEPRFVDGPGGDFHLTLLSPCFDAGDAAQIALPLDFEGDPRKAHGAVDMGADEFHPHLYHGGEVGPGKTVVFKAIGIPGEGITLVHGAGLQDPPWPTPYGSLHLKWPLSLHHHGSFPATGYGKMAYTLPAGLKPGQKLCYQLFSAGRLTNPLVLTAE